MRKEPAKNLCDTKEKKLCFSPKLKAFGYPRSRRHMKTIPQNDLKIRCHSRIQVKRTRCKNSHTIRRSCAKEHGSSIQAKKKKKKEQVHHSQGSEKNPQASVFFPGCNLEFKLQRLQIILNPTCCRS